MTAAKTPYIQSSASASAVSVSARDHVVSRTSTRFLPCGRRGTRDRTALSGAYGALPLGGVSRDAHAGSGT